MITKNELLNILNSVHSPILIIDTNLKISGYNNLFPIHFSVKPREIKKLEFFYDFFETTDLNLEAFFQSSSSSEQLSSEIKLTNKLIDQEYHIRIKASPYKIEDEDLLVLSFYDLTQEYLLHKKYLNKINELKETHEILSNEHRLITMGEMAAEVAHEINNPLAIIYGNLYLLQKAIPSEDEKLMRRFDTLQQAAERIKVIVKGLKSFSRKGENELSPINIHDLIQEEVSLFNTVFKGENIHFNIQTTDPSSLTLADPVKLQQVFTNLFTNSKDALEGLKDKKIDISIQTTYDSLLICVEDNGHGISEENLKKIFDNFFTTKELSKGTGLGMGVISSIIKNLGGSLNVKSTVDVGTTIYIQLPIHINTNNDTMKEEKQQSVANPLDDLTSCHILIIDDEREIGLFLKTILEERGAKVSFFSNPELALKVVEKEKFDLIITDYNMPEIKGVEVAKEIRKKHQDVKQPYIILLTGSIHMKTKLQEMQRSDLFDLVIEKPVTITEILLPVLEFNKKRH